MTTPEKDDPLRSPGFHLYSYLLWFCSYIFFSICRVITLDWVSSEDTVWLNLTGQPKNGFQEVFKPHHRKSQDNSNATFRFFIITLPSTGKKIFTNHSYWKPNVEKWKTRAQDLENYCRVLYADMYKVKTFCSLVKFIMTKKRLLEEEESVAAAQSKVQLLHELCILGSYS